MSVRNLGVTGLTVLPSADTPVVTPWVRSPSWLALTAVGSAEQAFRGLLAVFPDSSFAALTASDAYTVDWGDSTTDNVAAGATALKQYDYSAAALSGTDAPVTLTDAGDLVERTAHGYATGVEVRFYNIVTTTGISAGQVYYVINATANSFQIASTVGGSALALTSDGSATLLPYKQAIVVVTPQAGQNLTAINLNIKHTQASLQSYETGWLDIEVGSPNFTANGLVIASSSAIENVRFAMCERAAVRNFGLAEDLSHRFRSMRALCELVFATTAAVTNMSNMLAGCQSLQNVPPFNTDLVTDMSAIFLNCNLLKGVHLSNTASVVNMQQMFSGCRSIQIIPLFNTASVTNMGNMLSFCTNLRKVPLFNTASVTNMTGMLSGCSSIKEVPLFNTASVTLMNNMLNGCVQLEALPLFNTVSVTDMSFMFGNCQSMKSVPLLNTCSVILMIGMLQNCARIQSVPLFNTSLVTNMNQMFFNCVSLQSVPLLDTASVTIMTNMFNSCSSLDALPALVFSSATQATSYANMLSNCFSLAKSALVGVKFSHSYANCKLSPTALNAIYTTLPTVTAQTCTVTGNYGTAADNPSIATAKGWTVTG